MLKLKETIKKKHMLLLRRCHRSPEAEKAITVMDLWQYKGDERSREDLRTGYMWSLQLTAKGRSETQKSKSRNIRYGKLKQ